MSGKTLEDLEAENSRLRERLAEAESVLDAIRKGEVDAVVVGDSDDGKVFTLQGADHPYRVLVETMSEGAATLSRDGVILYANPKLAKLLETSAASLTTTRLSDWATEDDRTPLQELIESCSTGAVFDEVTLATSSGTALPTRIAVNPLAFDDESYFCAIVTDQSLARHHAALEEAAARIREVNEQLRDADQRKDVFLATLAHELRNPLAPIRTAAYVLGNTKGDEESRISATQIIERQVSHMTRLVDDLLEVSRITLGRLKLQKMHVELADILVSVTESIEASLGDQHDISIELPDGPMKLDGDAVRLSQAINNVVENAIKYTPPGGRITISAHCDDGFAVVRIRDTGIGISEEALPRIFEMFTQEERPGRRNNGGLGIGLALTRSIVDLHGGVIEASSAGIDQGSEFVLRLPLDEHEAEKIPRQGVTAQQPGGQRILVVDDNVDAAETLRILLEHSGHVAQAVHHGAGALSAFEEFRPDLVLLDIGLPDIDGYEIARRLRKRHGDACPTLVALSGWGREEDKLRATEAGIDAYLTKPVSFEALSRLVAVNAPA